MANSKYEYVKAFEKENYLLPDTYIIIRVDGKGSTSCGKIVQKYSDIMLAYGDSDEYSFLLRKNLTTLFASLMSTYYMHFWPQVFPEKPLDVDHLPTFDARAVLYPSFKHIRDYFSWRQVDCHINNLYNTTFWNLVLKLKMTPQEAEQKLMGTVSADKNEILFKECGLNYNNELEMFKKGTILVRDFEDYEAHDETGLSSRQKQRLDKKRKRQKLGVLC
ncbi:tRNA(His) guanylyltransferase [Candida viswanathii]|uniref:tRNA(His) guanylyltransferase n=1 Tax=Candida viswanathii TaxID=5486 RepID=A0A367YHZ9_9ASCO|nr:tRNA(His) guanylyltransferase [Candida viswanathii]